MESISPPIVEKFRIVGLHGYKEVVIDFESNIRIVIAENGTGKTTILNALNSFLNCQFRNLLSIEFSYIECKFSNSEEVVRLDKKLILDQSSHPILKSEIVNGLISELTGNSDLDQDTLRHYLMTSFDESTFNDGPARNTFIDNIYYSTGINSRKVVFEKLRELKAYFSMSDNNEISQVGDRIRKAIGDVEVLYLPTYRRIEKYFETKERKSPSNYALRNPRFKRYAPNRNHMHYGLTDVEERLSELTEEVQRKTNIGYRGISARIIEDLLAGRMESFSTSIMDLPEIETLKRFFSRVGGSENQTDGYLARIKNIYEQESERDHNKNTLLYFLSQLSKVIEQTRQIEAVIEKFVEKVNRYLGSTSDDKLLEYDPEKMKVSVKNNWTLEEVKFNDLSSGEKQVISLLSYLFLDDSKKIILVDEPELSLSIDWQEQILVDMVSAESCHQLFAITHSPFIFDNELQKFAGPLKIIRTRNIEGESSVE